MNKKELIRAVAKKAGVTLKDARASVDALLSVITETLEEGEPLILKGFGRFHIKEIKPRRIKDFQTKQDIDIGAVKSVRFKPSNALKKKINHS